MAHIEKRGENSYRLTVVVGYHPDGTKIKKSKTVKATGKREAEKELAKFQTEVEAGTYIAPEKMTFGAFVEEWRTKYAEKGHLEHQTLKTYLTHIKNHIMPVFENMRLDQIKPLHIVDFIDKLGQEGARKDDTKKDGTKIEGAKQKLSPGSVQYIYRVLRNILSRAVEWKVIKTNPAADVKKPKVNQKELEVYDEQESQALFVALEKEPTHWRIMVTLALTTGLRRGELLGLEWRNVDLEKGTIDVQQSLATTENGEALIKAPKTKSSIRKVALPESVIEDLKEYRAEMFRQRDDAGDKWEGGGRFFVFSNFGKPLYYTSPRKWWSRFIARNKLRYIRWHDLRHTSATLLINQGVHAKIISSRLGHANILTTMNTYGHVLQSADQAAANKFDNILPMRQRKTN